MRLGVVIDYADDFATAVGQVRDAERLGVELISVAEAYSFDAVSRLGFLAAVTERVALSSMILPVFSRTPTTIGMTAAGLDDVSGGRFELGIGASGAQVVEGFHGVPFTAPLTRVRETVEVCRMLWRREPVELDGGQVRIPLRAGQGTGLGKPLRLVNRPRRARIPIAIAALTPRAVAQAAEIAEGWIPIFFHPELAGRAWGEALAAGRGARDPDLGPLDVQVTMPLLAGDDDVAAAAGLAAHRNRLALYIGGMGARGANFYAELVARYGFADEAAVVQDRYLAGDKVGAAQAVPDDLVRSTALIGDAGHVRERLRVLAAGVTTLGVQPLASTPTARLEQLEAIRGLLDERARPGDR